MTRSRAPLLVLAPGCASHYSITIDGDVLATDKEAPRDVRAGVYLAPQARAMLDLAGSHLRPLPDATVTIRLVHDRVSKLQAKVTDLTTVAVDPRTGHFRCVESGESSNGRVEAVAISVESPGRESVSRQIPVTRGEPFEETVTVVLDERPREPADGSAK